MTLNKEKLIGLPVFTQSGEGLGKISDFEMEPQSQKIIQYYVSSKDLIKEIFSKELIINSSQVISITAEKMVVEDNLVKAGQSKRAQLKQAALAN